MSRHDDDDRYQGPSAPMLRRRDLFKLLLGGAVSSSLLALPFSRMASAQRRPDAPAKRVLIFYFSGGFRSSTAFHASATKKYNPWGLIDGTNTPFQLGRLLGDYLPAGETPAANPDPMPTPDAAYALNPMGPWGALSVPRLRDVAPRFSVVGTWNTSRGDHYRAATEEPTGSPTGLEPGLLTRISAAMDARGGLAPPPDNTPSDAGADGSAEASVVMDASAPDADTEAGASGDGGFTPVPLADRVPSFHVEPGAAFGHTTESTTRFAPVPLFGIGGLPGQQDLDDQQARLVGRDWAPNADLRARLDQRRLRARVGWGQSVVAQYANDHDARQRVGDRLTASWIDVSQNDTAARGAVQTAAGLAPLTNAMLYEAFVRSLGPDPAADGMRPYQNPNDSDFFRTAMDLALAIRLLQLGSPAVTVEMGGFDTHSGERRDAPARFRFVGRAWATLHWLLSRMPEPGEPGRSMLDRTLVVTMSEFGRDPGVESTGFNNGEGSDHGADPSCYYFAHGIMGGGVVPGRHVGAASANSYVPAQADRLSLRRLHSTILWALGLENDNPDYGYPDEQPVSQLFLP